MNSQPHIVIMGASLDTGNNGVSALLASTIKCVLTAWPDARISLLGKGGGAYTDRCRLADGQIVQLGCVGVRANKTLWRQNHVLRLFLAALLLRLIPLRCVRSRALKRNPFLHAIVSADLVADITGGDSFSDIYGLRRFLLTSLHKLLILMVGADLVLLPQTYGPYRRRITRLVARCIIRRAAEVYSRDYEGLKVIDELVTGRFMRSVPQFAPDVAFVLDPIAPARIETSPGPLPPGNQSVLVGMNINGLLYSGGYTRNNMFALQTDYATLVTDLLRAMLNRPDTAVLLVPHVFVPFGHVESDYRACRSVFDRLIGDHPDRLFLLEGTYDQSEIKHIIGRCNFFVGSRMHACIAAASQCIPTVPLAYSRKFAGVFESIGLAGMVGDLRSWDSARIVEHVVRNLETRSSAEQDLQFTLEQVQRRIMQMFQGFSDQKQMLSPRLDAVLC